MRLKVIRQLANRIYLLYLTNGASNTIYRILKSVYFLMWSRYVRYRVTTAEESTLPKCIDVNPKNVYHSTIPERHFPTIGRDAIIGVLGGQWDMFKKYFGETILYKSIEDRFDKKMEWEDTDIYRVASLAVQNDVPFWNGCESIEDVSTRCDDLDRLYQDIKENGYSSQIDLMDEVQSTKNEGVNEDFVIQAGKHHITNELRVGIGRNGEIIRLGGGKHRLSIARVLDLENIPAVIVVRHDQWQTLRNEIKNQDSYSDLSLPAKRNLSHPDLQDLRKPID